jgi:hypothetical protein
VQGGIGDGGEEPPTRSSVGGAGLEDVWGRIRGRAGDVEESCRFSSASKVGCC